MLYIQKVPWEVGLAPPAVKDNRWYVLLQWEDKSPQKHQHTVVGGLRADHCLGRSLVLTAWISGVEVTHKGPFLTDE